MGKVRKSLTRQDWLEAALEALATSGLAGVKVLPLAKRLGVSRGSFYWHFENHGQLLDSLLEYWDQWSTDSVITALAEAADLGPRDRIWLLMENVIFAGFARHDSAIRAWALHDAHASKAVRAVDRKRIGTVTGLFREAGFSPLQAEARGRLLAVYCIGEASVLAREPAAGRRKLALERWRLLTDPAG